MENGLADAPPGLIPIHSHLIQREALYSVREDGGTNSELSRKGVEFHLDLKGKFKLGCDGSFTNHDGKRLN